MTPSLFAAQLRIRLQLAAARLVVDAPTADRERARRVARLALSQRASVQS